MPITVGLVTRLVKSVDGGRSWIESTRTLPPRSEPILHGVSRGVRPNIPSGWELSHVHVGSEGMGLAAGWQPVAGEPGRSSTARFWRTRDDGVTWQLIAPDIGRWGRVRAWPSWPPERVDSIAVLAGGLLAFAWDDPWLHEGPHSHLAFSDDGGSRWRYARMPDGCIELALGSSPLRVFSGARLVERSASGSLKREATDLEWARPPEYPSGPLFLRRVQFTSESEGFALCVTWPREEGRAPEQLPPPLIGLAQTHDRGRLWKVVSVWEGPRSVDLNERHELTLDAR